MSLLQKHSATLKGGLASAVVSFPISMTYGVIAFSPFGVDYAAQGIVAGLFGAIIASFILVFAGGRSLLGIGPRAASIVIFAALCSQLLHHPAMPFEETEKIQIVLAIGFLAMALAGLLQVAVGLCRLGSIVTYIPYSVISGFINASALLIIISQFPVILGLERFTSVQDAFLQLEDIEPFSLLPGAGTLLILILSQKYIKKIPAPIIGLGGGILLFQALCLLFPELDPGPTLSSLQSWLPGFYAFSNLFWKPEGLSLITQVILLVIPAAISMAALASFDTIFSLSALREKCDQTCNPNRELIAHGASNIGASLLGGLISAGGLNRSKPALDCGATSPWFHAASSLFMLLALVTLFRWVHFIPGSVIAAVVLYVGAGLFDTWIISQVKRMIRKEIPLRKDVLMDLTVILVVVGLAILQNLIVAVSIGTLIAVLVFVTKISGNLVKTYSRGDVLRSRKIWPPEQQEILDQKSRKIALLKLQGALFFGTVKTLEEQVDRIATEETAYLILDFKEVRDVDTTGIRTLIRLHTLLSKQGITLLICYIKKERRRQGTADFQPDRRQHYDDRSLWRTLEISGLLSLIGPENFFFDTDAALAVSEYRLILSSQASKLQRPKSVPRNTDLLEDLSDSDIEQLMPFLKRVRYRSGQVIFRQGDTGAGAYFILSGDVDIFLEFGNLEDKKRVQTITRGHFFGEMSLLARMPRTATAVAHSETVCFHLDTAGYGKLKQRFPDISLKLMNAVCTILARRLQQANNLITELES